MTMLDKILVIVIFSVTVVVLCRWLYYITLYDFEE